MLIVALAIPIVRTANPCNAFSDFSKWTQLRFLLQALGSIFHRDDSQ